jgi:DNA-binding MarR family transcriptional regulator
VTSSRQPSRRAPARAAKAPAAVGLDPIVHARLRLGILSALAASPSLTFGDLKERLRTTDGNLSVHARKLERAGYLVCTKGFDARKPRTTYRLSAAGRKALARYLVAMQELLRTARLN